MPKWRVRLWVVPERGRRASEGDPSERRSRVSAWFLGLFVAVAIGLVASVSVTVWLVADQWYLAVRDHGLAGRWRPAATLLIAIVGLILASIAVWIGRGDARRRFVLVGSVLSVAFSVVGMVVYPGNRGAVVVVLDPVTGHTVQRIASEVEHIWGVRSTDGSTMTFVGTDWPSHGCDWRPVELVIDLASGEVLATHETPSFFASPADVPPPPSEPDQTRILIEQGQAVSYCPS